MDHSKNIDFIIDGISNGDQKSFNDLFDLYYKDIYKFTGYFTKCHELKEEIVSDVFVNLWQNRKRLDQIDNIKAYLYISARNRTLYYLKTNKKDLVSIEDIPLGIIEDIQTPESLIISSELKKSIDKAVDTLPNRCKLIFLMAKEQGLKYREIAEILSISEKTINAQIVIAMKRLSESLKKIACYLMF